MTLSGEYIWTKAGHSVDTAGDINGDGFDDVIIGAPGDIEAIYGRAYIVLGANSGLSDMELSAADTML